MSVVFRCGSRPAVCAASVRDGRARAHRLAATTPTLYGHFARFNEWTTIDSVFEGRFLERVAPGAFATTFAHDRHGISVLFQHGRDPQIGDKPLGVADRAARRRARRRLRGAVARRQLRPDLIPGLRAGAYGASFRFKVVREDLDKAPAASELQPGALPERTMHEACLFEFGPSRSPPTRARPRASGR